VRLFTAMSTTHEHQPSPFKNFLSGGLGGAIRVLVGHPFDTVKVRLQSMKPASLGVTPVYYGPVDCFLVTFRKEGLRGLYRGMSAPLIFSPPYYALAFMGYSYGKLLVIPKDQTTAPTFHQLGMAGAFSTFFTSLIWGPTERLKCYRQVEQRTVSSAPGSSTTLIGTAQTLYRQGGLRSIFSGTSAMFLRDGIGSYFWFSVFELCKTQFTLKGESEPRMIGTFLAGGLAGVSFWATCMPVDTLKSRLQVAPLGTYPNGIRSVFKELIEREGFLALYRGLTPTLTRAFVVNAVTFFGSDVALKQLSKIGLS